MDKGNKKVKINRRKKGERSKEEQSGIKIKEEEAGEEEKEGFLLSRDYNRLEFRYNLVNDYSLRLEDT
ncbi:unnamed protein product [Onchocerca flexuosa]|uniref:Uncharacterized protein n=1 Tax=Onchocerca flexuosa TaxID=387005 RepID=A0A183H766_9BILA|nr:unnamed protein product [Onchocerca flexuosa]